MGLSLADELGDELDPQLSDPTPGVDASVGLGQSLADELDLSLESELDPHARLREDGLPMPRSTPTPRKPKTSTASTYYTATASPGRLSLPDSADEVSQDLLQLSDNEDGQDHPFGESSPGDGGVSINDAGIPSPRVGEDMLVILQEQLDDRHRFIALLRSSVDPSVAPRGVTHSLNRSARRSNVDAEDILRRHLDELEQTKRELVDRNRDIAKIHQHFSQSLISQEVLDGLREILENHRSGDTRDAATPKTVTPDQSFDLDPDTSSATATAANEVARANKDFAAECSSLSESVHLHQSFLTSTTRQIKALKANVAAWKDKEEAENRARASIEQWERSQVERGLRGQRDTKDILDELVDGFRDQLAESDDRVKTLRRAGLSTRAVCAR